VWTGWYRPRGPVVEMSADRFGNGLAGLDCAGAAAEIAGARAAVREHGLDRRFDRAGGLELAEMLKHHGAGPDLADRIGDTLPGDVRRGPVHRLEHGWIAAGRIDVAGRRDPDAAGNRRTEIGEDVAEEIRADHHVEPVRMVDEMRRQDVDVELVRLDVWII